MYNNFVGFLNVLGAAIPSIGAIIIADYFIVKRRNYKPFADMTFKNVNWIAMVAWAIGVAFAQLAPGITPLNALIGTAVVYTALMLIVPTKESKEKGNTNDYTKRKIAG
jgi:cytosine permease